MTLVDRAVDAEALGELTHAAWREWQLGNGLAPHAVNLSQAKGGRPVCVEHVTMEFPRVGTQTKPCPFPPEQHHPQMAFWPDLTEEQRAAFALMGSTIIESWERYVGAD